MAETSPARSLTEADLQLWREAMMHLRHLSDDVFKSVALFMALNCVLLGAMIISARTQTPLSRANWLWVVASGLGIALTLAARFMLRRHRIYYLDLLATKSLIGIRVVFYDRKFTGAL